MEFVYKRYEDMTRDELHDVFWLRNVVFVCGQKITAEPEIDGLDPECSHAMLYADDGRLVGTARVFDRRSPQVVGRVAVHTDLQGQGHVGRHDEGQPVHPPPPGAPPASSSMASSQNVTRATFRSLSSGSTVMVWRPSMSVSPRHSSMT